MIGLKKFTAWDDNCVRGISRDLRGHCNHAYFSRTVNPLISPPGGLFISSPFEGWGGGGGGLIETGGYFRGALI